MMQNWLSWPSSAMSTFVTDRSQWRNSLTTSAVCHFCVGSVPIAVLVILNFLWRFLFWFAVFSIASYLAVTQEWMCTTFCFLYLCIFDILLLQIKYPPQPFSLTRVIIRESAKKHCPSQTRWIAFQRRFPTFAIQCLQCVTLITE